MSILKVQKAVRRAVDYPVQTNADFEEVVDPWLVRLARSNYSGLLAIAGGVALLIIGFALGRI